MGLERAREARSTRVAGTDPPVPQSSRWSQAVGDRVVINEELTGAAYVCLRLGPCPLLRLLAHT